MMQVTKHGVYTCEVERESGVPGEMVEVYDVFRQSTTMAFLVNKLGRVSIYGGSGELWSYLPECMVSYEHYPVDLDAAMIDQPLISEVDQDQDEDVTDLDMLEAA